MPSHDSARSGFHRTIRCVGCSHSPAAVCTHTTTTGLHGAYSHLYLRRLDHTCHCFTSRFHNLRFYCYTAALVTAAHVSSRTPHSGAARLVSTFPQVPRLHLVCTLHTRTPFYTYHTTGCAHTHSLLISRRHGPVCRLTTLRPLDHVHARLHAFHTTTHTFTGSLHCDFGRSFSVPHCVYYSGLSVYTHLIYVIVTRLRSISCTPAITSRSGFVSLLFCGTAFHGTFATHARRSSAVFLLQQFYYLRSFFVRLHCVGLIYSTFGSTLYVVSCFNVP